MKNVQSTKDYFDAIAEKWDTICHQDSDKINLILNLVQIEKNSRILDIATGTVILIPYLL